MAAVDPMGGCGVWEPTAEEIAASNADVDSLAAAFDRFGIAYVRTIDDFGFAQIAIEPDDVVADSVSQSFWTARYPFEPISQEELDTQTAQNDIIAAEFDRAGIVYTRVFDEQGYESVEFDYEDPAAQKALEAAWRIIWPPQPPDAETLARMSEENDALAAAFDGAGVAYQRFADDLGWQWLEWDYENQVINDIANSVYDELYPPVMIDPIETCVVDDAAVLDVAAEEPVEEAVEQDAAIEPRPIGIDDELSPDDAARREAEVTAMVDGFTASGVSFEVQGESPWQTVIFDLDNDASVSVITGIIATRS